MVPTWVRTWYLINLCVLLPDWLFIMLRPRSLTGGDLGWLFRIFNIYAEVDSLFKDYSNNVTWCIYAVGTIDLFLISFLYTTFNSRMNKTSFAILAVCRAVFVATKTSIYLLYSLEFMSQFWIVPITIMNSTWVWVPAIIIWHVSAKLVTAVKESEVKES